MSCPVCFPTFAYQVDACVLYQDEPSVKGLRDNFNTGAGASCLGSKAFLTLEVSSGLPAA